MSKRCGAWICLFCLSLVSGGAQQNRLKQFEPAASVQVGGADHRITLDVVVTDKAGKAVPGLEQRDFTLLDNKHPQQILSFHAVDGGAAAAEPPVDVILVLDELNPPFAGVAVERTAVEKYLRRNSGQLPVPVSLAFLTDTGTVRRGPSRDGNALATVLNNEGAGQTRTRESPGSLENVRLVSIQALGRLIAGEIGRPGRKLMVWVSPGWPISSGVLVSEYQADLFDTAVALSDGLRTARVTLYHVNAWGVGEDRLRMIEYTPYLEGAKKPGQVEMGNLGLQVLAHQSGGLTLNANNDAEGQIAACIAEASSFYTLAFDGLAGKAPIEYHSLELKLDKPGLTTRTRTGYYARPEPARAH